MAQPTAHTAAPPEPKVFPPFQSQHYPSQLIWLTISFVLLYVLMKRIALPRVGGILAARSKSISDDLAAAEKLKEQSDEAHAAYEKQLAEARTRAQSIASSTREQQARDAEAAHKKLEGELNEKLAAAERSIATTRTAAMGHVRSIAGDTASAIVERLIGRTPSEQDVTAALAATAGDLGKS